MSELLTNAEIIELRKKTNNFADPTPWSTTLAFARAIEQAVLARLAQNSTDEDTQ